MTIHEAFVVIRYMWTGKGESEARQAANRMRMRKGLKPLLRQEFEINAEEVRLKIEENEGRRFGRLRILKWALGGKDEQGD